MSRGGILIEYGGLSPEPTPFPLFAVLGKSLTLRGYLVHEITGDPARLEAAKAFILDGLETGTLRPIIDQDLSVRPDRRGASLSRIERAVRQDRGDDLRSVGWISPKA